MEQFEVSREQIVAVLEFVARSLKTPATKASEPSEQWGSAQSRRGVGDRTLADHGPEDSLPAESDGPKSRDCGLDRFDQMVTRAITPGADYGGRE